MKANELRFKNFVLLDEVITEIDITQMCNFSFWEKHEQDVYPTRWQPIPLTEKWIWKFGFEDRGDLYNFNIDPAISLQLIPSGGIESLFYPAIVNYPELSFEFESIVHLNSIRFVHQLQNLYFALTGEELEFKEK